MKERAGLFATLLLLARLAGADGFLPDDAAAGAAIDALPTVRAASARAAEASARADALAAGPYGLSLNIIPVVRYEHPNGATTNEWEASLTRSLRLPRKERIDRALGAAGIDAAGNALADSRHLGARTLLERWLAWLGKAHDLALVMAHRDDLAAEHTRIARQVALGDLAVLDLDRARTALASAELATEQARLAREEARLALLGEFPTLAVPRTPPPVPAPAPLAEDAETVVMRIVERSHEVATALALAERQRHAAERAAADRLPDPNIGLRVVDESAHQQQAIGITFSLPFAGPAQEPTVTAEGHLVEATLAEAAAVRALVENEARRLVRSLPLALDAWHAAARALDAARAARRRVLRAQALGEAALADVALARRAEIEAARAELGARLAVHALHLRIEVDSHERWVEPHAGSTAAAG